MYTKIKFSFSYYHHMLSPKREAVYSDLSDNYLIHLMAGAANCAKIRLTAQTMVWSSGRTGTSNNQF
jgi:hypothetical protein